MRENGLWLLVAVVAGTAGVVAVAAGGRVETLLDGVFFVIPLTLLVLALVVRAVRRRRSAG